MTTLAERIMLNDPEVKPENFPTANSKIVDFYKRKSIFVTGATGFLGKLLIEKLLRTCNEIETIYILVRAKKGEDPHSRIDKIVGDVIFGPLTKYWSKFQHKIVVIRGDIGEPDLGLNPTDKQLIIDKVDIIYHIAATVRFDEKINLATNINVRGTRDLIQIAKQCKHLLSFIHVSTAFANCNQKITEEKFYEPTFAASELIKLVESEPEDVLINKTNEIIKGWPNTYTFTKAIAENAVKEYGQGLPICVYRPSVVIATYKEPLRGWIDNFYGATGVFIGAGLGLIHSIHCCPEKVAEIVPADYVINSMIAASYRTAVEKKTDEIPIYNYVSGVENPITWEHMMDQLQKNVNIPSVRAVWYYSLTLNRYAIVHNIFVLFLHFLPGLFMDLGLIIVGKKPMMFNVYKKITKFESVISHFCTNQWNFTNDNTQALWKYLNEIDQRLYPFSIKELPWQEYNKTHMIGLRMYLAKDPLSTLSQARAKWIKLYIAHQILRFIFYLIVLRLIYGLLTTIFGMF